jgi:prevent-host-death family protein
LVQSGSESVRTVNIHEAKTHLSRLVERAAGGEAFVIAKAGRPMVKVVPLDAVSPPRRLGFMDGEGRVPDDFDRLGAGEIEALFAGAGPKRRRG